MMYREEDLAVLRECVTHRGLTDALPENAVNGVGTYTYTLAVVVLDHENLYRWVCTHVWPSCRDDFERVIRETFNGLHPVDADGWNRLYEASKGYWAPWADFVAYFAFNQDIERMLHNRLEFDGLADDAADRSNPELERPHLVFVAEDYVEYRPVDRNPTRRETDAELLREANAELCQILEVTAVVRETKQLVLHIHVRADEELHDWLAQNGCSSGVSDTQDVIREHLGSYPGERTFPIGAAEWEVVRDKCHWRDVRWFSSRIVQAMRAEVERLQAPLGAGVSVGYDRETPMVLRFVDSSQTKSGENKDVPCPK